MKEHEWAGYEDEMREWNRRAHAELKIYRYASCKIDSRCCRAVKGGCVTIESFEDPILMKEYTPRLNYCPECGKRLYDDED